LPFAARAQSAAATLSGAVVDENGEGIPAVEITVLNEATSLKRETTTNESGYFTAPLLPPGKYTLTGMRTGFRAVLIGDIILNVNDERTLRIQMKVGDVNETVNVTGEDSLINESPAVGTVIDRQFVGNLPLNGRSFQSLIMLAPGVVAVQPYSNEPGEVSINGQRQNANYFTVDGVSANTGMTGDLGSRLNFTKYAGGAVPGLTALGTTASLVSTDALEEFRIQTSTYSAEYGREPGGQIQLLTRSGTNQYHGTAFEYLRNDEFDAQDWFNAQQKASNPQFKAPKLRQNQFGGTFSGPVVVPKAYDGRNKTFFFFSYEGLRLRIPVVLYSAEYVPSLALRQSAAPFLRPLLNAFPLPTSPEVQIPQTPAQPYDPLTNPYVPSGFAPFAQNYSNPSNVDAYSLRLDHNVSHKLAFFARYAQTPSSSGKRSLGNQVQAAVLNSRALTIGSTITVTPRLNNELRFNLSDNTANSELLLDGTGGAAPVSLTTMTAPYTGAGPLSGVFNISFGPYASSLRVGSNGITSQHQMNIVDNLSLTKGPHQLKIGADWRRLTPVLAPIGYRAIWAITGIDYAAFSTNISTATASTASGLFNRGAHPVYDNVSAYVDDVWRVSSRLTLSMGLRWDINPPPHDAHGITPVLITGIQGTDVSGATLAPADTPFYRTVYTAFAPRVGFARRLGLIKGNGTTLRGGAGLFYDLGSGYASGGFSSYPFGVTTLYRNAPLPLTASQVQPSFPSPALPLNNVGALYALNPDLTLPYTIQWNLSLEQALGRDQALTLSYVASAARRLTILQNLNLGPTPLVNGAGFPPPPNPNFGEIDLFRNAPRSDYESLQLQYRRRLHKGLQAIVNYTWSHAIDEASREGAQQTTLERGDASFDIRHNITVGATYELPKIQEIRMPEGISGLVRAVANGWAINSIFLARTGQPIDVVADVQSLSNGDSITISPDIVPGAPIWIKDNSAPGGQRLNTKAFTLPPHSIVFPFPSIPTFSVRNYSRNGTLGRNAVRLAGINQINISISRQFNFTEKVNLQFRTEAFNLLNHPLFGNYDTSWSPSSATLGVPRSMLATQNGNASQGGLNSLYQVGGPRSMQFSLRLAF